MLDKIMMLPLAIYLYVFDIIGFVNPRPYEYYQIGIPMAFFYIACAYTFQGIYHYFHPTPMLLEAINEAIAEAEAKAAEAENAQQEESATEQTTEEESKEE